MTPRLIDLRLRGWARGQRLDWERALTVAWQTASLVAVGYHSPKKFPALKDVVPPDRRGPSRRAAGRISLDQMKAHAAQWAAVMGASGE